MITDHPPSRSGQPARPALYLVLLSLLVPGVLFVHFLIVWVYLTPTNPIKLALWRPVHEYIHPLFAQNWQLFAPTPIAHDELMMIRIRWRDQETNRSWESDWIDVTSPVYRAIQQTRVGPYSKLARPYTGLREMAIQTDPMMQAIRDEAAQVALTKLQANARRRAQSLAVEGPSDSIITAVLDSVSQLTAAEQTQQQLARESMYRIATAHAQKLVGSEGEVLAVNVRYALREFPRFSERKRPYTDGKISDAPPFGWQLPRDGVAALP